MPKDTETQGDYDVAMKKNIPVNINASIPVNISASKGEKQKDRVELAADAKYLNNIYFSRY